MEELNHCVHDLGLRGLKVGPAYQHFDPTDKQYWPVFALCEKLDIPVIWHQGTTFPSKANLRVSNPLMLESFQVETITFQSAYSIIHLWMCSDFSRP